MLFRSRPDAKLAWLPLRKGVADLHRRAQVSQRANDNYLAALASVDDTIPLADVFDLRFDASTPEAVDRLWERVVDGHRAWEAAG